MKLYYLSIPIMIGVLVGGVLSGFVIDSNNLEKITSTKLMKMDHHLWAIQMHQLQY